MKKASLAFNIIIVAVISLIVLAVVVSIFTGNANDYNSSLKNCGMRGGKCMARNQCESIGGMELPNSIKMCEKEGGGICCISIGDSE